MLGLNWLSLRGRVCREVEEFQSAFFCGVCTSPLPYDTRMGETGRGRGAVACSLPGARIFVVRRCRSLAR